MCPKRMNINSFLPVNVGIDTQSQCKYLQVGLKLDPVVISPLFIPGTGVKSLVRFAQNNITFLSWLYFSFDDTRYGWLNFTLNMQYFAGTPQSDCNYGGFKAQLHFIPSTKISTTAFPVPWPVLVCSQLLLHKLRQSKLNLLAHYIRGFINCPSLLFQLHLQSILSIHRRLQSSGNTHLHSCSSQFCLLCLPDELILIVAFSVKPPQPPACQHPSG